MPRVLKRLLAFCRRPAERRRDVAERARRRMAIEQNRLERLRSDRMNFLPFGV